MPPENILPINLTGLLQNSKIDSSES